MFELEVPMGNGEVDDFREVLGLAWPRNTFTIASISIVKLWDCFSAHATQLHNPAPKTV